MRRIGTVYSYSRCLGVKSDIGCLIIGALVVSCELLHTGACLAAYIKHLLEFHLCDADIFQTKFFGIYSLRVYLGRKDCGDAVPGTRQSFGDAGEKIREELA